MQSKTATLAENIRDDLIAIRHDDRVVKYGQDLLTRGKDSSQYDNAVTVLDNIRDDFVSRNETLLEDECQKGDQLATVYTGYEKTTNTMHFCPSDQRAKVSFLAGYAALAGAPPDVQDIILLVI